jgi:hypothetical protein
VRVDSHVQQAYHGIPAFRNYKKKKNNRSRDDSGFNDKFFIFNRIVIEYQKRKSKRKNYHARVNHQREDICSLMKILRHRRNSYEHNGHYVEQQQPGFSVIDKA